MPDTSTGDMQAEIFRSIVFAGGALLASPAEFCVGNDFKIGD